MDEEFDCPVCGTSQSAEGAIETGGETDFFRGYSCVSCDAKLNLDATSGQLELTLDVLVTCPDCGAEETWIEEVDEDSGFAETACESCGVALEVSWSDWQIDQVDRVASEDDDEDGFDDEDG